MSHFKGRVQFYEIWNEPNLYDCGQRIDVEDYVNLIQRISPVIRAEDPKAKIVVGSVSPLFEPGLFDYIMGIVDSDAISLVDAIAWHVGGPSPGHEFFGDYYYNYPTLVQQIKDTAFAHGFKGEFIADELNWRSTVNPHPSEPGEYSETVATKYYARSIIMHLGLDVSVGLAGISEFRPVFFPTIKNLNTVIAGVKPIHQPLEIESEATNIESYNFSLPDGNQLIALWTDGVAVDEDPGIPASITIKEITARQVILIDIFEGSQTQITVVSQGGGIVVPDTVIKDYPTIIKILK